MHSFDRTMLASLGFADPDKGDPTHDLACQYLAIPENQLKVGQRFSAKRIVCHSEEEVYLNWLKRTTEPGQLFTPQVEAIALGELKSGRPILEYVISKGSGQYKTTVGFIDLRLSYARPMQQRSWKYRKEPTFTFTDDERFEKHSKIAAEIGLSYEDFIREASEARYPRDGNKRAEALYLHDWSAKKALEVHQAYERVRDDYIRHYWDWFTLNVEVKANPVPIGNILRQVKLYAEYVEGKWLVATTYPLASSDVSALNSCNIGHVTLGERFRSWAAEQRAADAEGVQAVASTFTL